MEVHAALHSDGNLSRINHTHYHQVMEQSSIISGCSTRSDRVLCSEAARHLDSILDDTLPTTATLYICSTYFTFSPIFSQSTNSSCPRFTHLHITLNLCTICTHALIVKLCGYKVQKSLAQYIRTSKCIIFTRIWMRCFQLCTSLIKEQWDSQNRQYIKTGAYARGRSREEDLLQWFTFEGDSPGALQAFTKGW